MQTIVICLWENEIGILWIFSTQEKCLGFLRKKYSLKIENSCEQILGTKYQIKSKHFEVTYNPFIISFFIIFKVFYSCNYSCAVSRGALFLTELLEFLEIFDDLEILADCKDSKSSFLMSGWSSVISCGLPSIRAAFGSPLFWSIFNSRS